jgi:hypothetical protein
MSPPNCAVFPASLAATSAISYWKHLRSYGDVAAELRRLPRIIGGDIRHFSLEVSVVVGCMSPPNCTVFPGSLAATSAIAAKVCVIQQRVDAHH